MGICINCGNDIFVKDGHFYCDNCGEQTKYKCFNCKSNIIPEQIIPIYDRQKECSWCGFFICPSCNKCGIKNKRQGLLQCERNDLKDIIAQRYKETGKKTKINEAIQIIGNIKQGKNNRYCIKNIPYTYAKVKNKEYFCLMQGWKTKHEEDMKMFQYRYDEILNEEIGTIFNVNDKRDDGTHGQEIREVCNLAVCTGHIKRFKDEKGFWQYERINNKACEYWQQENLMYKFCPRCLTRFDQDSEQEYCGCEFLKGKNKGKHPKLKLKITNVSTCRLKGLDFKLEVKKEAK